MYTPVEVMIELADRVRACRLMRGWTQAELATRAGVVLVTLKKFERTGQISLERLLLIASVLDELDAFRKLFEPPPAQSLDELEARTLGPSRKYGRRTPRPAPPPDAGPTPTAKPAVPRVARRGRGPDAN